jgi:hypothetical protein
MGRFSQLCFALALAVAGGCSGSDEPTEPAPPTPNAQLTVQVSKVAPCYIQGPPVLPGLERQPIDSAGLSARLYVAPGGPFTVIQGFSQDPLTSLGDEYSCSFSGFVRLDGGTEFQGNGCQTSSIESDGLGLTCLATWSGVAP